MSLLQRVKRGLGLGQRRTSETTQQKLGTSNTCEVGLEVLQMLHEDGYAELVSAKLAYEKALASAAEQLLESARGAGYHVVRIDSCLVATSRPLRRGVVLGSVAGVRSSISAMSATGSCAVTLTL